jgi:hypothetical protein
MCFGSTKTPDVAKVPDPTPTPSPAASPDEVTASAESKRNKINALKYAGMQSTIRNAGAAAGVTGTGANLSTPTAQGTKQKIGE